MGTFYSTLAQIVATLLTILAAAVAGYFVFLQERSSQLDDQILRDQIAIGETLHQSTGQQLGLFMPPEFQDTYRAKVGGKSGPEFVQQAAVDFMFRGQSMQQAWQEIQKNDTFGGSFRGRTYVWILAQAESVLTRGGPLAQPRPEGIFPFVLLGPGFEEWRRDFQRLDSTLSMLAMVREEQVRDFQDFVNANPAGIPRPGLAAYSAAAVNAFFERVNVIRERLADQEKQTGLKQVYSFRHRVRIFSLASTVALSFLLGVGFPLLVLALRKETSSITAISVLVAALTLTLGAFFGFGRDVAALPQPRSSEYLAARWYTPMLTELTVQSQRAQRAALLDRDIFMHAANAAERPHFAVGIGEAIDGYVSALDAYNEKALRLNRKLIDALRAHPSLKTRIGGVPASNLSLILHPLEVLDVKRLADVQKALASNPSQSLTMEIEMPRWSRVELKFSATKSTSEVSQLLPTLQEIGAALAATPELTDYKEARQRLTPAAKHLEALLGPQVQSATAPPAE